MIRNSTALDWDIRHSGRGTKILSVVMLLKRPKMPRCKTDREIKIKKKKKN